MQKREDFAVLYFHEDKVGLAICRLGSPSILHIVARAETPFSGFLDGMLPNYEELAPIVQALTNEVLRGIRIENLYVEAPDIFTRTAVVDLVKTLPGKKQVVKNVVDEVLGRGFDIPAGYTVINKSVLYWQLDGGAPVADPVGHNAKEVLAKQSLTLCDEEFITLGQLSATSAGFSQAVFVPGALSTLCYLVPQEERDSGVAVMNCDMFSTTLVNVYGDGFLSQVTTPFGYAHIVGDLCIVMEIGPEEAAAKIAEANLSVDTSALSVDVIKSRIEEICQQLSEGGEVIGDKVLLTGDGIVQVERVRDYLSRTFGMYVGATTCPQTGSNGGAEVKVRALCTFISRRGIDNLLG